MIDFYWPLNPVGVIYSDGKKENWIGMDGEFGYEVPQLKLEWLLTLRFSTCNIPLKVKALW